MLELRKAHWTAMSKDGRTMKGGPSVTVVQNAHFLVSMWLPLSLPSDPATGFQLLNDPSFPDLNKLTT